MSTIGRIKYYINVCINTVMVVTIYAVIGGILIIFYVFGRIIGLDDGEDKEDVAGTTKTNK